MPRNPLLFCVMIVHFCITAALAIAQVREQVVFESGSGPYATYRIPSLVSANDGSIIAICEGRKNGASDAGDIDVIQRRSVDGGVTWGPIEVIWDDAKNTCGNPCPVVDHASGTIVLLLTWNAGHISEANIQPGFGENSRRVAVMSSNDNGKTWNQHRWITADVKQPDWSWYATGPGAGIELQHGPHAGRLIIPCDHKVISDNQIKFRSHIIYSDDQGRSWHLGGIAPDVQVNECEAVELSDGSILLNMRNYDKADRTRQVATSRDGGLSFVDQHHDRALIDPVCQASIRRVAAGSDQMPKGVILFSNPAHPDKREQLTIRASDNDTLSWPYSRSLYEGSAAYSCLALLPDGKIGCLYERDNYSKILLASFPLSWIVNDDSLESIK